MAIGEGLAQAIYTIQYCDGIEQSCINEEVQVIVPSPDKNADVFKNTLLPSVHNETIVPEKY